MPGPRPAEQRVLQNPAGGWRRACGRPRGLGPGGRRRASLQGSLSGPRRQPPGWPQVHPARRRGVTLTRFFILSLCFVVVSIVTPPRVYLASQRVIVIVFCFIVAPLCSSCRRWVKCLHVQRVLPAWFVRCRRRLVLQASGPSPHHPTNAHPGHGTQGALGGWGGHG